MTQIKSHLLPSAIIKIQFNYVNCNATFAARRGREIYDRCSQSKSKRGTGKKRRDLWLMFALRKRGGSRLFAVCLRYSYNSFTAYGRRINWKRPMIYNLSFQLHGGHLETREFARETRYVTFFLRNYNRYTLCDAVICVYI